SHSGPAPPGSSRQNNGDPSPAWASSPTMWQGPPAPTTLAGSWVDAGGAGAAGAADAVGAETGSAVSATDEGDGGVDDDEVVACVVGEVGA
ncbi:hypothetical protein K4G81_22455, partial [Mycobacterium tuberculosis]|nr:hypothetical protein [Mycobacterium tuberculosis]